MSNRRFYVMPIQGDGVAALPGNPSVLAQGADGAASGPDLRGLAQLGMLDLIFDDRARKAEQQAQAFNAEVAEVLQLQEEEE